MNNDKFNKSFSFTDIEESPGGDTLWLSSFNHGLFEYVVPSGKFFKVKRGILDKVNAINLHLFMNEKLLIGTYNAGIPG